jgi:hypothetical protein
MPSPFPGMDPYLEQFWRDVHARLVIYACDQLQSHLPGGLRARVEERVVVEDPVEGDHAVFPDVRVVERGRARAGGGTAVLEEAVAEPIIIHGESDPMTETFIEILDVGSGKRVVTVIEFLSLSNKTGGEGQEQYRRKQRELKAGRVSLVEIDLLRAGKHVLSVPRNRLPARGRTPYKVCVRRGWQSDTWEVYPLPLRAPLPTIKVPLRETDADVPLNLQALIEQCYKNGGYDDDLDYRADPLPPLEGADAAWADELLRSKGRR